ncbi:hypothetical protein AVEN_134754-1, partial [Araneus ventricosus]
EPMETFYTAANPAATNEEHMAPTSSTVKFISLTTTVNGVITDADKREVMTAIFTAVECTTLEKNLKSLIHLVI